MALIPKQTKAETKLMWGLTMNRFVGIVATMFGSMFLGNIIYSKLKIPFMIISIGIYLFLNKKAPTNPKKQYWQGIFSFFYFATKRKKYYSLHSLEYERTIKKEAERHELKIQKAQKIKDEKQAEKTAARNKFILNILRKERKLRTKLRKKQAKKASKLAKKNERKYKKENRRKNASTK